MKINFEPLGSNEKHSVKSQEVGEIIPFSVWIIPFPVLKINVQPLGSYENDVEKEVFEQRPGS